MDNKTDYSRLDAGILDAIRQGRRSPTSYVPLLRLAYEICPERPDFRVVDARLQALRKQGRVAYGKRKWEVIGD